MQSNCCILYIANRLRWKSFAVAELNCNSLKNICSWTVVMHSQGLLNRLFHWKSFSAADQSVKTAKLFHLERFAICSVISFVHIKFPLNFQCLIERYSNKISLFLGSCTFIIVFTYSMHICKYICTYLYN